ncbi:hypothetical protein evm_003407 [Chilo suppressalis]|nr:hypothetical protein evm_003407 [Chilo suppressalis]
MLTRLQLCKREFRVFIRCLSDQASDNNGKVPDSTPEKAGTEKKKLDKNTEKIQELLKQMLAAPKISEKEYREKFATAPERSSRRKQAADEIEEVKTEKIEESITKAAGEVAQAIGGDVKQTEAELLSKVLGKINQTSTSLSDLLIGMKVDRSKESETRPLSRGQQVKKFVERPETDRQVRYIQRKKEHSSDSRQSRTSSMQATTINIFDGEPLGIFKAKEPNYGTKLDVWESLKQRELNLATSQPPANYFQKMILWTEQGKVWKFPINNEQGLEEEQNVHFSEHVFLDTHLEGWCPKKGPIRHFMELVCVGLSKNAFYTVKEKKEHIMWYKDYFESKKSLLTEIGAWDTAPTANNETTSP